MDSLEEMDEFLEMQNLPRLNQEEIENMNRSITNTEIETVITKFTISKSAGPDSFTDEFYQTPILLKLFQKPEQKGRLSNSFYQAHITLITKPDKDTTTKEKSTDQYH